MRRMTMAIGALLVVGLTAAAEKPATLGFSVKNMDLGADPRKDFYRYAAGGWLDRTEIPASEQGTSGFGQLGLAIDRQLLAILQEAAKAAKAAPGAVPGPRQQIGDFYASAMDLARIEALGLQPLEADLARVAAVDSPTGLAETVARLQLAFGGNGLLVADVGPDTKQTDVNALFLAPSGGSLNRSEYVEDGSQDVRDLYAGYVAEMFALAGDPSEAARQNAATVLAMERALAAGTLTPLAAADPNATYNKMSLAGLQALMPALDLRVYLTALGVEPPVTVIVPQPGAMANLQKVLAERSADEIKTFLRWRVLSGFPEMLPERFGRANQKFQRGYQGLEESPSREQDVTRQVRLLFPHPLSRLYVEAYFPQSTRAAVETMVGHIRSELRERLATNPWLSPETREQALAKLDKLQIDVGYPDEWIDMGSVVIERGSYVGNVQRVLAFNARRSFATLGKPMHWEKFAIPSRTTPIDVNAAYVRPVNSIEISAAILQPPFFDPDQDAAVNYCTIGAVIGHEITHGFDNGGRLYDASGNLRNWWTDADAEKFMARAQRLVDQFNAYEVLPGLKENGALTLGENIADLGGIVLASQALQRSMEGKPRPADVDGLSPEQRCFLAWAQLWMSKARPEALRQLTATDTHAVSAFRAAGPLVNLDEFFQAFGIREGDPMWTPPADRVRIW